MIEEGWKMAGSAPIITAKATPAPAYIFESDLSRDLSKMADPISKADKRILDGSSLFQTVHPEQQTFVFAF